MNKPCLCAINAIDFVYLMDEWVNDLNKTIDDPTWWPEDDMLRTRGAFLNNKWPQKEVTLEYPGMYGDSGPAKETRTINDDPYRNLSTIADACQIQTKDIQNKLMSTAKQFGEKKLSLAEFSEKLSAIERDLVDRIVDKAYPDQKSPGSPLTN